MRHSGWRRLRGDTDRPDLLDLGKKLLGYLDNQRRLSGVRTLEIQRTTPDGAVVRAQWVGDLPIISVLAPAPSLPPPDEEAAGGFVVWPSDATRVWELTPEPAVYLELGGRGYSRYYHDSAHANAATPAGSYAPWFPGAPSPTLQDAGNVDWRSADEKHSVTWHGPKSRYWVSKPTEGASTDTDLETHGKKVYRMGQVLFDWNLLGATLMPLVDGMTAYPWELDVARCVVFGAAIERGESDALLVVMRLAGSSVASIGDDSLYALYRVPLPDYAAKRRVLTLPPAEDITAEAALFVDGRPGGVGTDRVMNHGFGHPWLFNSRATQARCLHYLMTELVLERDAQGAWSFRVEQEYPAPNQVTSSVTDLTYMHKGSLHAVSYYRAADLENAPVLETEAAIVLEKTGYNDRNYPRPVDWAQTYTTSWDGDDWLPCAVDFSGATPVYAYQRLGGAGTSYSHQASTATISLDVVNPEAPSYSAENWWDVKIVATCVMASTSATDATGAHTCTGLRTPWGEWTGSESTVSSSSHSYNGTTIERTHNRSIDPNVTSYQGDMTAANESQAAYERVCTYVCPLFLDLRSGLCSIGEVTLRQTTAMTWTLSDSYVWGRPDLDTPTSSSGTQHPEALNSDAETIRKEYRIRTYRKQELLADVVSAAPDQVFDRSATVGWSFTGSGLVLDDHFYFHATGRRLSSGSPKGATPTAANLALGYVPPADLLPAGVSSFSLRDYCLLWAQTFDHQTITSGIDPPGQYTVSQPELTTLIQGPKMPASFMAFVGTQPANTLYWMRSKVGPDGKFSYGSWQFYQDRIAFSHVAPIGDATTPEFAYGLSRVPMPDAVGVIQGVTLYHPIWVLPAFDKSGT